MNDRQRNSLFENYKRIPEIACKGLCFECCGPIALLPIEVENFADNNIPLPLYDYDNGFTCDKLENNRCTIYENRPLVCRMWGNVAKMQCPHGCKETDFLSPFQSAQILRAIRNIKPGELYISAPLTQITESYESISESP